ncbi:MAG: holo-ACP synthase [Actinobacteria bacterium]|nr:holo-ACP synthase [Actinomycetota bacterium]
MIVGIGVDVVNVLKFGATLRAAPGFTDAVFTERESVDEAGVPLSESSLAARYAAKEALAKALGTPGAMRWHDAEVLVDPSGLPRLATHGAVAAAAQERGIDSWHLSLATEGDVAVAYVVAEGRGQSVA